MSSIVGHFDSLLTHIISLLGMDPPKEVTVSDVTEDALTVSWIQPLAPFEYYKLSYQSERGSSAFL